MPTPIESFELDEGVDQYGTRTRIKFEGDQAVKIKTFDATDIIERAKAMRNETAGQRWGEMRKVGELPMAIYSQALTISNQEERTKFIRKYLRENQAFVTFDRYLK